MTYGTREYLLDLIVKNVFFIEKVLYSDYILLFLLNNAKSYSIYIENVFQVTQIYKIMGDQQLFFRQESFIHLDQDVIDQEILIIVTNPTTG